MTQILIAALMWGLMLSMLIVRRRRADRSITYTSIAITIAMTLNVDAVYTAVDPALGGTNLATLIADALLMIGLFFLGRGVMHTGEYRPQLVRVAVSLPMLLVSLVAITIAFMFIERDHTTTLFMVDLGDQAVAATYSIINFVYCGIVIAAMMVLAARQYRSTHGVQRLPAALVTLGAVFGVALCISVIVMDVAHATGQLDLMHAVQPAYAPLSLLTFVLMCAGFTAQPVVRRAQQYARRRRTTTLAARLEPVWERATHVRPGLSQASPLATGDGDPEAQLHRKIVEIRDAMIDGRVAFTLDRGELSSLEAAERHLLGNNQEEPGPADLAWDAPADPTRARHNRDHGS